MALLRGHLTEHEQRREVQQPWRTGRKRRHRAFRRRHGRVLIVNAARRGVQQSSERRVTQLVSCFEEAAALCFQHALHLVRGQEQERVQANAHPVDRHTPERVVQVRREATVAKADRVVSLPVSPEGGGAAVQERWDRRRLRGGRLGIGAQRDDDFGCRVEMNGRRGCRNRWLVGPCAAARRVPCSK